MTYNYIISVFVELVRTILIVQYFQVFFDKNNSLRKYLVSGFMFVATVLVYITFNNVILNMIITFVTIFAIANVYSRLRTLGGFRTHRRRRGLRRVGPRPGYVAVVHGLPP